MKIFFLISLFFLICCKNNISDNTTANYKNQKTNINDEKKSSWDLKNEFTDIDKLLSSYWDIEDITLPKDSFKYQYFIPFKRIIKFQKYAFTKEEREKGRARITPIGTIILYITDKEYKRKNIFRKLPSMLIYNYIEIETIETEKYFICIDYACYENALCQSFRKESLPMLKKNKKVF